MPKFVDRILFHLRFAAACIVVDAHVEKHEVVIQLFWTGHKDISGVEAR